MKKNSSLPKEFTKILWRKMNLTKEDVELFTKNYWVRSEVMIY